MSDFATVQDVIDLWRPLSQEEQTKAGNLIPLVCDALREEASRVGQNLDNMIAADTSLASVAKMVTVDIVARVLRQSTDGDPMTQESQSGLGYSWSGTYAVPGGGISNAIMKNDLKRLGIKRQRYGVIEFYENQGN
jgi:hypothetical protein